MRAFSLKLLLSSLIILMLLIIGCDETQFGFGVRTLLQTTPTLVVPYGPDLNGDWLSDYLGAEPPAGSNYFFFRANGLSSYYVTNGRCPATWRTYVNEAPTIPCGGQFASALVFPRKYTDFLCSARGFGRGMISSPSLLQEETYNNVTITGPDISDSYGMPKVYIYNYAGTLVSEAVASSCGPPTSPGDDPWMNGTVWVPDLSPGDYTFIVSNRTQQGGYEDIGGGYFYIVANPPPCDPTGEEEQNCYATGGIWYAADCRCIH